MKNILVKIGSINRRIIFILIALSVLIPLLKPDWFNFPIKIDKNTEDNCDYVKETLPFPRAKFDGKVVDKINEIITNFTSY